jgi:hypothetical protein
MERCILGSSRNGAWINVKNKGVTEVIPLPNTYLFLIMAKSP